MSSALFATVCLNAASRSEPLYMTLQVRQASLHNGGHLVWELRLV